jgi:hypothetical protein
MGVDEKYGNRVIYKSEDDGSTWTTTLDGKTGLIRQMDVEKG